MSEHTTTTTGRTSRRAVLAGALGGAGAWSLDAATARSAQAARPASALAASGASKAERAFLAKGLQHGSWVAESTAGGRYVPTASAWAASGLSMPTFYEAAQYSPSLMSALGSIPWSTAKSPGGQHITSGPGSGPFLTPAQQANVGNLFSVCLGDEEGYSSQMQTWMAQYAAKLRSEAPNALVHSNQYSGQWSDAQIRSYILAVQPDLLTWDNYYYSTSGSGRFNAGSVTPLYNDTWRYRRLALTGSDGNGTNPLCFGQYTLGFRQGTAQQLQGTRTPSQSELWLPAYVTWALGGKWLNLFRWEHAGTEDGWLLNDSTGALTYFVDWYGQLGAARRRLSPYLVRLRTTNAGLKNGQYNGGGPVSTPTSAIPAFSAATDPGSGLSAVQVSTPSPRNGGLPGDVLVGTFRPIPGLTAAELGPYVPTATTPFFMVVNAMGVANDDITSRSSSGGESDANTQGITLTLNPAAAGSTPTGLRMLNPRTGAVTTPTLSGSGSTWTTTVSIGAGTGMLFWWV